MPPREGDNVRVAIVTESFLPSLNGVTTSVCQVLRRLAATGHEAMVIAPNPAPTSYAGFPVRTVTSVEVRKFQVALPSWEVEDLLVGFAPDVVHAASPFVLGAKGLAAGRALGIPTVAIYQTDLAAYVARYSRAAGRPAAWATWQYLRWVHSLAALTLAPSRAALADLAQIGVTATALWARGVDTEQFDPAWRDDAGTRALRRSFAGRGEVVIGYVGRLAHEKELDRLATVADLPGTRLVLTGEGPSDQPLREMLPNAAFLGRREHDDLARAYAACDVFVHTGTTETFGQTLQEAAAMGLPIVAPARGGPLDLIQHERTGLLFDPDAPPSDRTSLRGCLERLTVAEDAWQRRALYGESARAAVAHRSWARLVDELLRHYSSIGQEVGAHYGA